MDEARQKRSLSKRRFQVSYALGLLFRYCWFVLLFGLAFLFRKLVFSDPLIAEYYSSTIRPIIFWPFTAATNLLPFSVSLIFLGLVAVTAIVVLIRLFLTFRQPGGQRLLYVIRHFSFVGTVLAVAFMLYMLGHGANFARMSLADHFGYTVTEHSSAELFTLTRWLRDNAGAVREGLNEDADGVYVYPEGETTASMLLTAHDSYDALEDNLAVFAGQFVRPKIVWLSYYWSYTGTSGMFFPLLGEANVNTDINGDELLFVALHEIAHVKGIAREDEANYMAFYTGITHESPDYQYSAWLQALISASNQLYRSDKELWAALWADMPETIRRDLAARSVYWKQFEGPVQEQAQNVNNTFLKANGEEDGIRSYGRMVDLVLAYYEYEVLNADRIPD